MSAGKDEYTIVGSDGELIEITIPKNNTIPVLCLKLNKAEGRKLRPMSRLHIAKKGNIKARSHKKH